MTHADSRWADREATITAYLRHAAHTRHDDTEDFWAWEAVFDFLEQEPASACWALVLEMVQRADADAIGVVSADVLEKVVRRHGADLLDAIEERAANDEKFRHALGEIWLRESDLPPDALARVVRASGNAIEPMPPLSDEEADNIPRV